MEYDNVSDEAFQHVDRYDCNYQDGALLTQGINKENALDYFRRSPFYTDNPSFSYEAVFDGQSADFFKIIKKWTHKESEEESKEEVVAVYYVLKGTIYQCPDLYSLLKYRMYNCINYLNQSYLELRRFVSFSPFTGHQINNQPVSKEEESNGNALDNPVCSVIPILGRAHVQSTVEKNTDCLDKMISDMEKHYQNSIPEEVLNTAQSASV